ncbi:glycine cleavage system protein T [Alteromonas sp. IB21]|uniref:CAF17-like 4Fe-4S cluster assembly/insertion protein YgfZ n=1 Tax=Alteromonas sp. IB21 TaxID=2779369 RepID=UPI0018E78DE3|nr:glycine cleavage system protein T [Alteromonas sp. IB21]MBJ2130004.1 glycine cleavage system protein T [Alteromonas sp. IB21]
MTSIASLNDLPGEFMVKLSNSMIISLEGEQADNYLHGQITVNINKLDKVTARHFAHCDNKGKTWATGYVTRHANKLLLLTNADAGHHSLAQLNKYGVFSKVDIVDDTPCYNPYFLSSDAANNNSTQLLLRELFGSDELEKLFGSNQNQANTLQKVENEHGVIFAANTSREGFVLLLTKDASEQFEENTSELSLPCFSHTVFDAIQIESVHAMLDSEAIGEYVPQMINVQALNGIDFDKGCYMGQEVVARTRFLGKNKRAAYSFKLEGHVPVKAGDSLEKQLGDNWRVAGKVLKVAALESETWFIAVLNNDTTSEDLHRLADNNAITCYPNSLPYNIEQQASNIVKKRR